MAGWNTGRRRRLTALFCEGVAGIADARLRGTSGSASAAVVAATVNVAVFACTRQKVIVVVSKEKQDKWQKTKWGVGGASKST